MVERPGGHLSDVVSAEDIGSDETDGAGAAGHEALRRTQSVGTLLITRVGAEGNNQISLN